MTFYFFGRYDMASVLCSAEDIDAVTSCISTNVGKATETEINGEINELDLGPAGNLPNNKETVNDSSVIGNRDLYC